MRTDLLQNQRGAALLVTLAVVAVLMVAALQLRRITADAVMSGTVAKNSFLAREAAMSGVHLASQILAQDAELNTTDSLQEDWADETLVAEVVSELGYGQGVLNVKITDEMSRIQINALLNSYPGNEINPEQLRVWEAFLRLIRPDESEAVEDKADPAVVLNSLKDWLDSGDDEAITGISGAESEHYMELDPPYTCTNGPLNHILELFLIKGVKEMVSGGDDSMAQSLGFSLAADPGQVITVYGLDDQFKEPGRYRYSGKVNINTAPVQVLAALLPEGMEEFAQDLADFRLQKGEQGVEYTNTLDKGWYKRVIDLSKEGQAKLERTIGYSSHLYRVESKAVKNGTGIIISALLKREKNMVTGKWKCRIIQVERKY